MPVSSYPRVTVQGTGTPNNPQNGQALMIVNPITGKYEAATAATFAGGGGGDATAANQTTQINEAQTANSYLSSIESNTFSTSQNTSLGSTAANQTTQITEAQTANSKLTDLLAYIKVQDFSKQQACTATFVALENTACVKVTLIAQSTNTEAIEYDIDSGNSLFLEAGYSVVINVTNSNKIRIRQTGGAGETAYYIRTTSI